MKESLIWLGVILLVAATAPLCMTAYAVMGVVDCWHCVRMLWRNWRKRRDD